MTICGLTLLPKKVRPTIFLVLMSMNAISFESRFTIITTEVGSATLMSATGRGAEATTPVRTSKAATIMTSFALIIAILQTKRLYLKCRRQPYTGDKETLLRGIRPHLEHMRQV